MELSWEQGFSLDRKPTKRSIVRKNKQVGPGNTNAPRAFEFIMERPMTCRDGANNPSPSAATPADAPELDTTRGGPSPVIVDNSVTWSSTRSSEDCCFSTGTGDHGPESESTNGRGESMCPIHDRTRSLPRSKIPEASWPVHEPWSRGPGAFPTLLPFPSPTAPNCHSSVSIPPPVLYNKLSERFTSILDRYNMEFCRIPLTSDLHVNPFRYRAFLRPEPPRYLVNAVMALAGHHVESTSAPDYYQAALQQLQECLGQRGNEGSYYNILDTIIILFSFDETQSALGNWTTHLRGAYGLLEASGGIQSWIQSPRVLVQVGMLTWWDAITSLVSREACVFPHAYFDAVLSRYDGQAWDYFGLCGCPLELVQIVMRLAHLSAEKRRSTSMEHVRIDNTVVSEIEHSLESWAHSGPASACAYEDEEAMQRDLDTLHCSEAWRHGLLLYVYRVFHWRPGVQVPMAVLHRARTIADHVFAAREESMVSRQALLPLFFAGCELRDPSTRRKILEFCSIWNTRTRYHVFGSAIPLLEQVWAEQEDKGTANVCWTQMVDRRHAPDSGCPFQRRLCFG
ncbi:hypothetical protein F4778DRAFT_268365 [Xylariomycetidae sp. FL2044]|nr:hypothetical protein F4778DRAFT_268365 [Xylariomycetidae sp. FL2044]